MSNHKLQYSAAVVMLLMLFSFQLLRTQLRVMVKDDTGKSRPGTEVTLYNSATDYNNDKKAFGPIVSDKKGRAIFNGIGQGPYLLEAVNGDYTNEFEDQMTGSLEDGKINKIEVIISE